MIWIMGWGFVSLFMGHFLTKSCYDWCWGRLGAEARHREGDPEVPRWLLVDVLGCAERGFFTLLMFVGGSWIAPSMVLWLVAKWAFCWGYDGREAVSRTLVMLISSLVSLSIAMVGGLVCQGILWAWFVDLLKP